MMVRIWHGWTHRENADAYEQLLHNDVLPGIVARAIPGFIDVDVLRRDGDDEVEFITVMTFEREEAVQQFAGDHSTRAVVPPAAQALLSRYDPESQHYHLVDHHAGTRRPEEVQ